ncbi:MAG: Gfo/Idh/MocA family oxidoreductase [Chloroflexia bacterium]|nr:Gfo/Idh/MocA family oxidoreductase [Chloroflexia bacterium]
MIGCGGASSFHAQTLLSLEGTQIVALVDTSPASLERMRERNPQLVDVPDFATTEDMYDAVELDAVQIITPHSLHYPQVKEAIEHGAHVLCEKPLAIAAADARDIAAKAGAAGVIVTVSYQRRLDPAYAFMRQAIEAGELGEIQTVAILNGQGWRKGTEGSWRQDPALSGGGMLMDSGSHHAESLLSLAGRPVASVSALVETFGLPIDINSTTTVGFEGGLQGQLTVIGNLPATWIENVTVSGTKGILRYETEPQHPWRTGRVTQYKDGGITQPLDLPGVRSMDPAWLAAIRGEIPNPSPPEVGVRVAELTEAIYQSAQEGRTVHLQPVTA